MTRYKRKNKRDGLYADAMAILTDALKPTNEDKSMSDAMPKKWMKTKCYRCRHFWAYPEFNGDYEDWTWECENPSVEADNLVGTDEDCEGFSPMPIE